jgi:hypothetical protein
VPWDTGPRRAAGPQPLTLRFTPTISTGAPMAPVAPPADFLQSQPRRAERFTGPMPASPGPGGVVAGRVVSGPLPSAGQSPRGLGARAPGPIRTPDGIRAPDSLDGEDAGLRRLRMPPFRPAAQRPGAAFGQEILRTMRSRNLVTGLAIPIMVAMAVGIAVVVAVGANNGPGGLAPSQLSAGFPPARVATADFAGSAAQSGRGTRVALGAVAAFGSQVVAVGAQSGGSIGRALFFHSSDNGHTWRLGTAQGAGGIAPPPQATPRLVTGGPAGWVAIGAGFTFTSPDGQSWLVGPALPQQPGDQVTAVTTAGTGFIATGHAGAGGKPAAPVLWLSATGTTWRRLAGPQLSLPVAAGARVTGITHVAASGTVIVLAGTVTTAGGAQASAAWRSADGGATWAPAMIPAAANDGGGAIAGIAPLGNGFVAARPAVINGTRVAIVYTSADGAAWRQSAIITTGDRAPLTIGEVTGGPGGASIEGSASGFLFAFLSTNGTTWLGSDTFGASASQRVSGAALTATGQAVVAVSNGTGGGLAAQYPVLTRIGAKGAPVPASVAGIAGVRQAELAVNAIAASGATQVAGGSADGFPALWSSPDGGSTWARGTGPPATFNRPGDQQVTGVADGRAGWVAVGGAASLAPGHPMVAGSADGGRHWTAEDGATDFARHDLVTSSVAAGRAGGYAIVGWQVSGGHPAAMAWYSAGLTGWRQAVVSLTGGDSQLMAVTAMNGGFVAAGSSGARPAAWVSPDGKVWRQVTLALPASAARAVLQYVTANGDTVVAAGTALTASGARFPFAAISTDGGSSWDESPLPAPSRAGTLALSGLTAAGSGFTATGTFGEPGNQDVVIWTHGLGGGGAWMAVAPAGNGLSGPGVQEITALASAGSTLTGAGFTATTAATVPTLWQSPIRG